MAHDQTHLDEKPDNIYQQRNARIEAPGSSEVKLDDSEDPMKFPVWQKWIMTVMSTSTSLGVTFGSSVFSSAVGVMSKEFGVSEVVMLLGVSLYVTGFALGPLLWGPLSERYGRKTPLFGAYILFVIFQIPVAVSRNLPTIFIFRFLAGVFGGSPVVINSATFADYWAPTDRGKATAIYSLTIYLAPCLGPIVGSFAVQSHLGWPWTAWFTMILGAFTGILAYTFVPETYEPELIKRKAKRLGLPVPDTGPHVNFVQKYLSRPVKMMTREPMLICMTLYISLVYGILYLSFFAIPYSFETDRHWSPTISSLPFLGIMTGVSISSPAVFIYSDKYYQPRLLARGHVLPEDRLPPMMIGSIILPAGLFWFAWTSTEATHWVLQVLPTTLIGAGIMLIFTCGIAFIVDIYLTSSASALAANMFVRSISAAGASPAISISISSAQPTSPPPAFLSRRSSAPHTRTPCLTRSGSFNQHGIASQMSLPHKRADAQPCLPGHPFNIPCSSRGSSQSSPSAPSPTHRTASYAFLLETPLTILPCLQFPLFAPTMYRQLGTAWATSVLGFICVSLIPAPVVFYLYGARLRARSRFTPKPRPARSGSGQI